jgi:6-phosphogluconate dehydrogenase
MVQRLLAGGHTVIGYARHRETVDSVVQHGMVGAYSLQELVDKLHSPRAIWLTVPAASVDQTIAEPCAAARPR